MSHGVKSNNLFQTISHVQKQLKKPPIPKKTYPKAATNAPVKSYQPDWIVPKAEEIPEHFPEERPEDDYDLIDSKKMLKTYTVSTKLACKEH